jgi:hypothetical protein
VDKRLIGPAVRKSAQANKWSTYFAVNSRTVCFGSWDDVTGGTALGLVCEVMLTSEVLDVVLEVMVSSEVWAALGYWGRW